MPSYLRLYIPSVPGIPTLSLSRTMTDTHSAADNGRQALQRNFSTSSSSNAKEKVDGGHVGAVAKSDKEEQAQDPRGFDRKLRVVFLIGLAALILGWWISSTVLKATRGRWQVSRSQDRLCACSQVLQGCTDNLRLVLFNVSVNLYPTFQGPTDLHFQCHCVSVYPKLSGHTSSSCCMGPFCPGALVPPTSPFEIDHRLAVPPRHCFRVRLWSTARCSAQNHSINLINIDLPHRVMTMAIKRSPYWVCSFSSAASTSPPPTALPYAGTCCDFDLSSHLKV